MCRRGGVRVAYDRAEWLSNARGYLVTPSMVSVGKGSDRVFIHTPFLWLHGRVMWFVKHTTTHENA